MSQFQSLLEPSFLRRLDALRLTPLRPVSGGVSGSRRSLRQGASVEFADYREYVSGDDLRSVDWNAYGRLEKLFLKLFIDDEDLGLHLLLDTSGSMAFGLPVTKSLYAKKLAAALGYVALTHGDRVSVCALQEPPAAPAASLRGLGGIGPLFSHLNSLPSEGETRVGRGLMHYAARSHTPGIAVIMSDFYDDAWVTGVKALASHRFQIVLIHLVAPEEVSPAMAGELRLRDAETGEANEFSLSPALIDAYQDRFQAFCAGLETAARRYDLSYLRLATDVSLSDALKRMSESGGFLH